MSVITLYSIHYTKLYDSNYFSAEERHQSRLVLFRLVQNEYFFEEIVRLGQKTRLPRYSKLLRLDPFVDLGNLLRVGGWLQNAHLSFNETHPIILPTRIDSFWRLVEFKS